MSVKVKRSILKNYLRKALFEQFSAQGYQPSDEDSDDLITVPTELPLNASEQMATQLSKDRPPIEDDEFIPSSVTELGLAADAIGQMVPDDQVEYFYLRLKDLLDNAIEKHNTPETVEEEEVEVDVIEKNEAIDRLFRQASFNLFEQNLAISDDEISTPRDEEEEGAGLEDLASTFGYKAASGVRQDLERILKRLGFTASNITDEQLDALQNFAASEFVDALVIDDYIDDDDAKEMRADPYRHVNSLDSFRFFFTSGFMLPAYQKIVRDARKRVESEIDKLNVPHRSRQTILNQAFGDTPQNMSKLEKKLTRDASAEGIEPAAVNDLISRIRDAFPNLVKIASVEGDIVAGAMDIWQKAGAGKKSKILKQALESTAGHQDQFGE